MECIVKIENVPNYVEHFIVARLRDGKLWYWGSWEEQDLAEKAAKDVKGIVVEVDD